jgi:hypothetical protein
MQESSRKLWLLPSALMIALALPSLAAPPEEAVIKEGSDCWQTETGTEQRLHTLPAGFFGNGSNAVPNPTVRFQGEPLAVNRVKGAYPPNCGCPNKVDTKITWLDPHGNQTRDMRHAVKQVVDETTKVDTCIRRKTNAKFKGKGVAQKVDIQLVALSLKSVEPLKVSYKDGHTKSFDIWVTESGTQDTGTMTFTPKSLDKRLAKGDVKLGSLHITYDVKFVEHGGTATYSLKDQKLHLVNTPGTFEQLVP